MYGLLLEAIKDIITNRYGEDNWVKIRQQAGLEPESFGIHDIFPETHIPRISKAAAMVLEMESDDIMYEFGMGFVLFVSQYEYDKILRVSDNDTLLTKDGDNILLTVLGRHMRDFLNGLDNLHDHMRFSYKKMSAPSFFVENETKDGLTLHYRTRRTGYIHYVMGQIKQVGRLFYKTEVEIHLESEKVTSDGTQHVTFNLIFDNSAFREPRGVDEIEDSIVETIPLRADVLFELFPFHVVFAQDMLIRSVGCALDAVVPNVVGKPLTQVFRQARPLTTFSWDEILAHTNNVFELVTVRQLKQSTADNQQAKPDDKMSEQSSGVQGSSTTDTDVGSGIVEKKTRLCLKGQMIMMKEWNAIMFLGTPVMNNLEDMFKAGLYINDLSMHDCSRDLVLAGTQQSAELKMALDQEQSKSHQLTESMKKLDDEIRRTDEFVYQMIPKPVAVRLRQGESAVNTCECFDCVTILFSDVVGFTTICSRITPMEVVSMLNAMYTSFDRLSEKHSVYKVETIGDAYMAVAGAPTVTEDHAESMCDMSLDMLAAMPHLKDPSSNDSMRIRIGIHTGSTVAGVVGLKMPRYCLFGDTVNTASRMESTGQAMKIHISLTTKEMLKRLVGNSYVVVQRKPVNIKGKGPMKTYWLEERRGLSVQEKKEKEAEENAQKEQPPEDNAAAPTPEPAAASTPTTEDRGAAGDGTADNPPPPPPKRKMYCPVSFDDLTNDRVAGGRRTSVRENVRDPFFCKGEEGTAPAAPHRQRAYTDRMMVVSVGGASGERRVSSPCTKVSGLHASSCLDRSGGLRPASAVADLRQGCPFSGPARRCLMEGGDGAGVSPPASAAVPPAATTGPAEKGECVRTPAAVGAYKPTQTVRPTCSSPPSPPQVAAAGRPPDGRTPHGNIDAGCDSSLDNHNPLPAPPVPVPQPSSGSHPQNTNNNGSSSSSNNNNNSNSNSNSDNNNSSSNNDSYKSSSVLSSIPPLEEDGPSSVRPLQQDVVSDRAGCSQAGGNDAPAPGLNNGAVKNNRNGKAKSLKRQRPAAEQPLSKPGGRQKSPQPPHKSRSKACVIL